MRRRMLPLGRAPLMPVLDLRVWVDTGAGWYPIRCTRWSMVVLCVEVLLMHGLPREALLITRTIPLPVAPA